LRIQESLRNARKFSLGLAVERNRTKKTARFVEDPPVSAQLIGCDFVFHYVTDRAERNPRTGRNVFIVALANLCPRSLLFGA